MKKKIIILILSIVFCCSIYLNRLNSPIKITEEMLEEETEMESAWDFYQNLNIGWNLGMSFSANIKYKEIIKYKIVFDDYESDMMECGNTNEIRLEKPSNKIIQIAFDIPYSSLDGTLYWSIDELTLDEKIVLLNRKYESYVEEGKLIVDLVDLDYNEFREITIKISIDKFYEFNDTNKVNFYETFWCETKTTKELINTLKEKGFNAVRISFDVYNHINNEGIIDDLWINRLVEVVDYCMELDVYCLVDIVETYGLYADDLSLTSMNMFKLLWTQLANVFKEYDHKLLFSPFNELRNTLGDWNTSDIETLNNMNVLYQTFVDTIRATGGNNKYRNLILTTYAASISETILNKFELPNDVSYNHLLVESHYYQPVNFTFNEINLGTTDFTYEWGSAEDKKQLSDTFKLINKFIKDKKVPFIIGEFGTVKRTDVSERIEYLSYYKELAKTYKVGLFIFDDAHDFVIIDRRNYKFIEDDLVNILVK